MNQKIKPLPPELVAQVAAGEVIERPASIVKELIENSLDAGATQITIELEQAGKNNITVSDNGQGIPRSEFEYLTTRHATSKIRTYEDLWRLHSFGFRGEALASVAAVATLEIQSKSKFENKKQKNKDHFVGFYTRWEEGQITKQRSIGMDYGTRVVVSNLFAHIPGRSQFLKQDATEWRHIVNTVAASALAHPSIRYKLIHNQQTYWELPPTTDYQTRLQSILGDISSDLVPVEQSFPHLGVQGWIGRPPAGTSRPRHQYLFINGRPVSSQLVTETIKTSLRHHLDPRSHPIFVLQLKLPPETVDVNVHPRKQEVKFLNQGLVQDLINTAIHELLRDINLEPDTITRRQLLIKEGSTNSYAAQVLKQHVLPTKKEEPPEQILQVNKLYLAVNTPEGLLLIDQHAAHERILYEKFHQAFKKHKQQSNLATKIEPITWQPSASEKALLQEHETLLQQLGFTLTWKQQQLTVSTMPSLLIDRDPQVLLGETLDDLAHDLKPRSVDTATQLMLAYLACRSAIKGGDYLTPQQRVDLLAKLAQTKSVHTCPHGRPLSTVITIAQLEKMFARR